MKRRAFLKGAAATGAVAAATTASSFPTPAISQGIKQLRMVTTWPKNFPGLGTAAEDLSARVNAMTDGKIQIKVFAAGELVPPFQSFDAVSSGTADMSHSASYYWQGKHKALNFFTAVPFGLTAVEHATWIYSGGGQALWDEVCAQFEIKPILRASTGVQMGGWYRKEINSLEDYKGLKFRMPGLGGEVLRRLGVAVVNLPGGEIFPALQSGAIDGTEWVGPWNDLAFGFYKVAKYYYHPGFHEPGTTGEVLFNKKVWEGLGKENQAILDAVIQAQAWKEYCDFVLNNANSLPVLINKHGVQMRKFSNDIMIGIGKVAGEVVKEVGNSDPLTKKVYDSYIDIRKNMIGWSKIGEQGYMNARSLPFKYT
jgi:TRAP-type mannitol/chloroaromatic compound transport system substrate-binding protein